MNDAVQLILWLDKMHNVSRSVGLAHTFRLSKPSLKRHFAVYVVLAKGRRDTMLYVGKTGDNREGCNPLISRCGNHFSYNSVHSQIRNKIKDHENREYVYCFDHFDSYQSGTKTDRVPIDRINEMERWLNQEIQALVQGMTRCKLLNPYIGTSRLSETETEKRKMFRTRLAQNKIRGIVKAVCSELS